MSDATRTDRSNLSALQDASRRLVLDLLEQLPHAGTALDAFLVALAAQPQRIAEVNARHYSARLALWGRLLHEDAGRDPSPAADRRFSASEWTELPFFRFLRATYEEDARWIGELIDVLQLPADIERRVRFLAKQFVAALAPTNQFATNPDAIRRAFATQGGSVREGLERLQADVERGSISMSDHSAFEVGANLACSAGAVVYENEVMQLIEYTPLTERVHARPLLIVPPFINKYYILDLQPHNSFVRFALERGLRVFMISWRNAGEALREATWDDYTRDGIERAIQVALEIARSRQLNALGFCVGGTLLASALAAGDAGKRVANLTLLACLLDFSDVGEIQVFVDEDYVAGCERDFAQGGLMPGSRIAWAFASLRPDELVWYFVVNNYLKGQAPAPFDLLYWNSDSANVPGRLFAWYLRHMYRDNSLRTPGALQVCGRPADLGRLRMPAYVLAARDDHIVPWRAAWASARLLAGTIDFVLGASGHVAGVVAPPCTARGYWRGDALGEDADAWLSCARHCEGSWWEHWAAWIVPRSGALKHAPGRPGSSRHPVIEPAPGRYVRERADAVQSQTVRSD